MCWTLLGDIYIIIPMAYIIDKINKYAPNKNVCHTFVWGNSVYGIRKVQLDEYGEPQFPEKDFDAKMGEYHIYNTLEAAMAFIAELRLQS